MSTESESCYHFQIWSKIFLPKHGLSRYWKGIYKGMLVQNFKCKIRSSGIKRHLYWKYWKIDRRWLLPSVYKIVSKKLPLYYITPTLFESLRQMFNSFCGHLEILFTVSPNCYFPNLFMVLMTTKPWLQSQFCVRLCNSREYDALPDLVPFVRFKKREKHPYSVTFSKVAGFRLK